MADRIQVYLPPSRFVSGSLTQKRDKNSRNQPIAPEDQRYEFGVAINKAAPETQAFFGQLQQAAHAAFVGKPNQAIVGQYIDNWFNTMQGFSMKVSDGDKPAAATGKPNENTAGHYVVWFSSNFAPSIFDMNGQPVDAQQVKRGYFVDGMCGIVANDNNVGDGVGIFMNPDMLRFVAQGDEIRGGPDFDAMMAAMPTPTNLPAGASPIGSAPTGIPPMQPGMPQAGMQQPTGQPMGQGMPQAGMQQPPQQPMQQQPPQQPMQQPMGQGMPAGTPPVGNAPAMGNGLPVGGGMPQQNSLPTGTGSPANQQHPSHPGIMPNNGGLPGGG